MCNEKYLLWFVVGYDFNPVHLFSIPLQNAGIENTQNHNQPQTTHLTYRVLSYDH